MLPKSLVDIICASRIVGTISTFEDINKVWHKDYLRLERNEKRSLRRVQSKDTVQEYFIFSGDSRFDYANAPLSEENFRPERKAKRLLRSL